MTVEELITKLQHFSKDATVHVSRSFTSEKEHITTSDEVRNINLIMFRKPDDNPTKEMIVMLE